MTNRFTKQLFVFTTVMTIALLVPGMALATPSQLQATSVAILAQAVNSTSEVNLTPQQRQQLQAIRQRRNREIAAVLNSSQRHQLSRSLRSGNSFNEALEQLELQPGQQELVQAVMELSRLKMKAIASRSFLPATHN